MKRLDKINDILDGLLIVISLITLVMKYKQKMLKAVKGNQEHQNNPVKFSPNIKIHLTDH